MQRLKVWLPTLVVLALSLSTGAGVCEEMPKGWWVSGQSYNNYFVGLEKVPGSVGNSAFIRARTINSKGFATLMQQVLAESYSGKRVRLSARLRTADAYRAQLWMRVDGPDSKMLGFDNMDERPVTGATDWKRYEVVLDVPVQAYSISFGFLLARAGQVWADDFKLEVVERTSTPLTVQAPPLPTSPVNPNFDQFAHHP